MYLLSELKGKNITSIETNTDTFNNVVLTRNKNGNFSAFISTSPSLNNGDIVSISGISTTLVTGLNDSFSISMKLEELYFIKKFLILLRLGSDWHMYQVYQSKFLLEVV